ncbi:uncharacterized protein MKZ38_003531 [Zalerion maritima]|uniref:C2H2-type domain-containing protein n=1 Tax=Zalerion maritima TaxID=339359 RepID=A0AAD5RUD6_9PEZI|nr:uncharacterized protein MKZ38_003531 [Zalerion maritima]
MAGVKRSHPEPLLGQSANKRLALEEALTTTELESSTPSPLTYASSIGSPLSSTSAPTPNTDYSPSAQPLDNKTCPHCFKVFNRRPADLKKHLKVHITERNHVCSYADCGKAFRTEKDLKEHVDYNHLNERGFACSRIGCKAAFNTASRLRRHEEQVHQSGIRCSRPGCGKRFRNQTTLNRHQREHDGLRPFACKGSGCNESFKDNGALRRHVNKVHKTSFHWCEECDLCFKSASSLMDHHKKTHRFRCSFCPENFNDRDSHDTHVDTTHAKSVPERKTITCPDCPKTFTRVSNMNAHHRSAHQHLRFLCGKIDLSSYEDLVEWDALQGCGDSFTTKVKLVEHIRFRHLNQPRPRATPQKLDLIDALAGPTVKEMPAILECDEAGCGLKFKRIKELEKHKARHSAARDSGFASLNRQTAAGVENESEHHDGRSNGDSKLDQVVVVKREAPKQASPPLDANPQVASRLVSLEAAKPGIQNQQLPQSVENVQYDPLAGSLATEELALGQLAHFNETVDQSQLIDANLVIRQSVDTGGFIEGVQSSVGCLEYTLSHPTCVDIGVQFTSAVAATDNDDDDDDDDDSDTITHNSPFIYPQRSE